MKKLIVMALAALAVSAPAASIQWNAGSLKNPANGTGVWGATSVGNAAGYMNVWFFATLANAQAFVTSGYTSGDFVGSTLLGVEGQTKDSSAAGGIYSGLTANSFSVSTVYYTVARAQTTITGNIDPALNKTWFMYTAPTAFTTLGTGNSSINFLTGAGLGGSRVWPTNWTPVPEPSTGLMAIAGLGMLLRRRRA